MSNKQPAWTDEDAKPILTENEIRAEELARLIHETAVRLENETWEEWCWRVLNYIEIRMSELTSHKEER